MNNYIRNMNIPDTLDNAELIELFKNMQNGNPIARNIIIEHNLRLVWYLIEKEYKFTNYDKEDLASIGTIGLMKAVDAFDINKNIKFSTFAMQCIHNEIKMFFRKRKHEIEQEVSLDTPINNGSNTFSETIPDDSESFIEKLEDQDLINELQKAIEILSDKEKDIISMYFGFKGTPISQGEIAKQLGVTQSRISRMIKKIILKLKEELIKIEMNSNKEKTNTQKETKNQQLIEETDMTIEDYEKVLELISSPKLLEIIEKYGRDDIIILLLKFGYINNTYFSNKSIIEFFNIEEAKINEVYKKGLLIYRIYLDYYLNQTLKLTEKTF